MKTICKKDIQTMKRTFKLFPLELRIVEMISDSINAAIPNYIFESYMRHYPTERGDWQVPAGTRDWQVPAETSDLQVAAASAIIVYTGAKVQKECSWAKGRFHETAQEIARRLNCDDDVLIKNWIVSLTNHEMYDRHWNWGRFSTRIKCNSWDNILEIA